MIAKINPPTEEEKKITKPSPVPTITTNETPDTVTPELGTVGEKSTVSGQLNTLLDKQNPYIKQARDRAVRQTNKRGLINSSIAASAGEEAAIQSALPIAQQDAQTFYDQQKTNQADTNNFRENEQAYNLNRGLKEQEQRHTIERMDVDQVNKENFARLETQLGMLKDKNSANLQAMLEEIKADAQVSAQQKQIFSQELGRILDTTQQAIANIGQSDASASQQANAVSQMIRQRDAQVNMLKNLMRQAGNWNW